MQHAGVVMQQRSVWKRAKGYAVAALLVAVFLQFFAPQSAAAPNAAVVVGTPTTVALPCSPRASNPATPLVRPVSSTPILASLCWHRHPTPVPPYRRNRDWRSRTIRDVHRNALHANRYRLRLVECLLGSTIGYLKHHQAYFP